MTPIDETWIQRKVADWLGCFMCGKRLLIRRCPDGLCQSIDALREENVRDWRATESFVFSTVTCPRSRLDHIRYIRQFMFLHIAQTERAVIETLGRRPFGASREIRILDIGSGPGTLFLALAALKLRRHPALSGYSIEYCPLDPSRWFLRFIEEYLSERCVVDGLSVGFTHHGDLKDIQSSQLRKVDWFFLGNALTAITEQSGSVSASVELIGNRFNESQIHNRLVTLVENSAATDLFGAFCAGFRNICGIMLFTQHLLCRANWLQHCAHSVRPQKFRSRLPYAVLHMANFKAADSALRTHESTQPPKLTRTHGSHRGAKWTDKEDEQLREENSAGQSVAQIASAHGRTEVAIKSRLVKIGLLDKSSLPFD